ncbi:MAG: hypothetical protein M3Q97_10205 [Bacteroidota bacterium]|nr:hypothetical protein [Bacteroidota bacterium]
MKLLCLPLLFLISCSAPEKHELLKEGRIHYQITYGPETDSSVTNLLPDEMTLRFKGNVLYCKLSGGLGSLKPGLIINGDAGNIIYLNVMDSTAIIKPLQAIMYPGGHKTSGTTKILNYPCTEFTHKIDDFKMSVSAADDIPFQMPGTVLVEGFYLSDINKMPLEVTMTMENFSSIYKADDVISESQPDSLFEIPSWRKVRVEAK